MTLKLGILMDPISTIKPKKDTSLAMLLAAQARGWALYYMEQNDVYYANGTVYANTQKIDVHDDTTKWYALHSPETLDLSTLDAVLMRKDPPFDMNYITTTYMLSLLEKKGTLVINNPQGLRDANEKFMTTWFPELCPNTLISANITQLHDFCEQEKDIIVKPLDGMGGRGVFRIQTGDANQAVILETLTSQGKTPIIAQTFLNDISKGDKRIIIIDGKPIPYALTRFPAPGQTRANLAAGGSAKGVELSERDYFLCEQIAPTLRKLGLVFVGLDVIGDYITEINVTSPTCVRELDALYSLQICDGIMDYIERHV